MSRRRPALWASSLSAGQGGWCNYKAVAAVVECLSSRRMATVEKKSKLALQLCSERSVSSGAMGGGGEDGEPQIKVSRRETGSRGRGDK